MARDFQRSKVYKWEAEVVHCRCSRHVSFKDAQSVVDGIFLCEGLLYPPKVERMPKQVRRWAGDATRGVIRLHEKTQFTVILHELAHSMTMTHHGDCDSHGPDFMGVYLRLLDKYAEIPLIMTMYTLKDTKIKVNYAATPKITDFNLGK